MAKYSPFSTRRLSNYVYEFNSMLDSEEDRYDIGIEAYNFDSCQPYSINFIANGFMHVWYFTCQYAMEYVASIVYDFFGENCDLQVRDRT